MHPPGQDSLRELGKNPERESELLKRELADALEQQSATSAVLRVIATSPNDLQPILNTLAERAAKLCDAYDTAIFLRGAETLRVAAHYGPVPIDFSELPLSRDLVTSRAVIDCTPIHVHDLTNAGDEFRSGRAVALRLGFRTILATPLLGNGRAIGALVIRRVETRPFNDRQIALVKTFADQAAIAIENARLFEEVQARNRDLTEALEQQTATGAILRAIASSPTDIRPVLTAVTESAARLCKAFDSVILLKEGEELSIRAHYGSIPVDIQNWPISRDWVSGRAFLDREPIHVSDLLSAADEFPVGQASAVRQGHRTIVAVPLLREGQAIGVLVIRRIEVRPFTTEQIGLLTTFADQAVIAIENVRLFEEAQQRNRELEATSEVLRVISRSPTDTQPVFNAIAESAAKLCNSRTAYVQRFDGEFAHFAAQYGLTPEMEEATRKAFPILPGKRSAGSRAILSGTVEFIPDYLSDPDYDADLREAARLTKVRGSVAVPMIQNGRPVGAIILDKSEPGYYPERQVELLKTFADQAVIAIENVRLFEEVQSRNRELTEALDAQTATGAILQAIATSPTEIQPVLNAVVESAARLCDAHDAIIYLQEGDSLILKAHYGPIPLSAIEEHRPISRDWVSGRAFLDGQLFHVEDVQEREDFPRGRDMARRTGYRTILSVPLMREGNPLGAISIRRLEKHPFEQQQIDLLTTFANQAVIAIENVRLFDQVQARTRELQQSLEYQTATSEVLNVISRSPNALQPILDVIVETAVSLCEADFGTIARERNGGFVRTGQYGSISGDFGRLMSDAPVEMTRGSITGRTLVEGKVVHILDAKTDPEYTWTEALDLEEIRSGLGVPLLRDGAPIGAIALVRRTVKPFTDKQIELVTTFADQAVIAIENARLFEEVQARTRELTEALEYQTATSEVLGVISRSPSRSQPVLDAIVATAGRLCQSEYAFAFLRKEDGKYHFQAGYLAEPAFLSYLQANPIIPGKGTTTGRAVAERRTIHIPDGLADPDYAWSEWMELSGTHTFLSVPLLRDGDPIGAITAARKQKGPFVQQQIDLFTTFADQAVIAIENSRLFEEVQARSAELSESLQQQTATADVLKVISRSAFDLKRVLDTLTGSAVSLCNAEYGFIFLRENDEYFAEASAGASPEFLAFLRANPQRPGRSSLVGRVALSGTIEHIPDRHADAEYNFPGLDQFSQVRASLGVPLIREGRVEGIFALGRSRPEAFTARQIELVQTFADQAVIAIENVRLFDEVRARTKELSEALRQQTATADVLKTISRSTFDLKAVLQTLVESAAKLCDADKSTISRQIDGVLYRAEAYGVSDEYLDFVRGIPIEPDRGSALGRVLQEGKTIHIADVLADPEFTFHAVQKLGNFRTILGVPMLREREVIGVLALTRTEVRPFTEKQIELVSTFADQAAIAIENARLFDEVKARTAELTESLQQQTATADVLKVISRSAFDLQVVLDTLVESACRLCHADMGDMLFREASGTFRYLSTYGFSAEYKSFILNRPSGATTGTATERAIATGKAVHIEDVLVEPGYNFLDGQAIGGFRTLLAVPLLRQEEVIGVMTLQRKTVRAFAEKQIELVATFADQAVIAIENARLFDEVQERTKQLSRSLEELRNAQDRLVQTEKLASLGQLTAGIAHEIKNPLNFVNNFSTLSAELVEELREILADTRLDERRAQETGELLNLLKGNLDKVNQHGKRADSIIKNMLLHSRQGSGDHRLANINAIVEESLNLAYHGARAERQGFNITLERAWDPDAGEVDLYPQEITRVLLNLISNGFYATVKRAAEGDPQYQPTLLAATRNLGDRVEIRIRDNGSGIPPEVREKIFVPFFTTKPAGEGTGLGLSLSHDIIVKQHAGIIDVSTQSGEFTEFRIILPRTAASLNRTGVSV